MSLADDFDAAVTERLMPTWIIATAAAISALSCFALAGAFRAVHAEHRRCMVTWIHTQASASRRVTDDMTADEATENAALVILTHVLGGDITDEFWTWYKPEQWLGIHRAVAAFIISRRVTREKIVEEAKKLADELFRARPISKREVSTATARDSSEEEYQAVRAALHAKLEELL